MRTTNDSPLSCIKSVDASLIAKHADLSHQKANRRARHAGVVATPEIKRLPPVSHPSAIVDIGAYQGWWSETAREVFPDAEIIMVEPVPDRSAQLSSLTTRIEDVLNGASSALAHAEVIILELSIINSYSEGLLAEDMIHFMQNKGFLLHDIAGLNRANRTRSVNEFDAVFVR